MLTNGRRFSAEMWDMTVQSIRQTFKDTTPNELFQHTPGMPPVSDRGVSAAQAHSLAPRQRAEEIAHQTGRGSPPFSFHSVIIKCVVQLELVEAVENILLQRTLSEGKISHGAVECEQDPKVCSSCDPSKPCRCASEPFG